MMEVKIHEDSAWSAVDGVNELLEKYNLRIEFKEEAFDGYEVITIVETKDSKCPDWDE